MACARGRGGGGGGGLPGTDLYAGVLHVPTSAANHEHQHYCCTSTVIIVTIDTLIIIELLSL